jgi:hypothetical protein
LSGSSTVSVTHRDLDMGSLAEERARERGRSLGEHAACGTNLDARTRKDRNREQSSRPTVQGASGPPTSHEIHEAAAEHDGVPGNHEPGPFDRLPIHPGPVARSEVA